MYLRYDKWEVSSEDILSKGLSLSDGTSSCHFLGRLTVKVKLHFHRTQTVRGSGNAVTPKPC